MRCDVSGNSNEKWEVDGSHDDDCSPTYLITDHISSSHQPCEITPNHCKVSGVRVKSKMSLQDWRSWLWSWFVLLSPYLSFSSPHLMIFPQIHLFFNPYFLHSSSPTSTTVIKEFEEISWIPDQNMDKISAEMEWRMDGVFKVLIFSSPLTHTHLPNWGILSNWCQGRERRRQYWEDEMFLSLIKHYSNIFLHP